MGEVDPQHLHIQYPVSLLHIANSHICFMWGKKTPNYFYLNNKQQDLRDERLKNICSTKIYFVELTATVCLYPEQTFLMP